MIQASDLFNLLLSKPSRLDVIVMVEKVEVKYIDIILADLEDELKSYLTPQITTYNCYDFPSELEEWCNSGGWLSQESWDSLPYTKHEQTVQNEKPPLYDYLYYELLKRQNNDTTGIGRCVQDYVFDNKQAGSNPIKSDTATSPDSPEVVNIPYELNTPEARALFSELVKQGFAESNGAVYRWKSTNALFGYMVNQVSERLNIRPDNDRLPWAIFQCAFGMSNAQIRTATNHQSKLNNGAVNEPTGYEKIKAICK